MLIKSKTHCLFARQSKVWTSRPWDASISFKDNVQLSLPAFSLFASMQKGIDGFCFEVAFPGAGATVDSHARIVNKLLRTLR